MLSGSKSYIFIVFFKAWFGIIIFGMGNGFILLPVMLSYVGPTFEIEHYDETKADDQKKESSCCAKAETSSSESFDEELNETKPKPLTENTMHLPPP